MKAGISYKVFPLILFLFCSKIISGQENNKLPLEKCARLEAGFIMGALVLNDNLMYNPGGSFQYSYCLKSGDKAGFGLGAGVQFFEEETFVPFYFDFIGLFRKNPNTSFLTFQAGYALGWSSKYDNYQDYTFKGGIHIGAGLGHKFRFNDSFSFYAQLEYKHQFASLNYAANGTDYYEKLNYDMLIISIGIMLEQK
jgi:hypothetical protein